MNNWHSTIPSFLVKDASRLVATKEIAPQKPLEGLSLLNLSGHCAAGVARANLPQEFSHQAESSATGLRSL
jgi:hypothetical protein